MAMNRGFYTNQIRARMDDALTGRRHHELTEDMHPPWSLQSMKNAPFPVIRVAGIGRVTGQDGSVRENNGVDEPREFDAAQVEIEDAGAWNALEQVILQWARDEMRLTGRVLEIRLQKLCLYTSDSSELSLSGDRRNCTSATIVVLLPASAARRGSWQLWHDTRQKHYTVPCSEDTEVITWRVDVSSKLKPVTEGRRVALWYDVVHAERDPLAGLGVDRMLNAVRGVMHDWREASESNRGPGKLVYLLQDRLKAARERRFFVGLATLTSHLAEDPFPVSEGSNEHVELHEMLRTLGIEEMRTPDGHRVSLKLEYRDDEAIPGCLIDILEDHHKRLVNKSTRQELAKYEDSRGIIVRTWRRTVVVMWPA